MAAFWAVAEFSVFMMRKLATRSANGPFSARIWADRSIIGRQVLPMKLLIKTISWPFSSAGAAVAAGALAPGASVFAGSAAGAAAGWQAPKMSDSATSETKKTFILFIAFSLLSLLIQLIDRFFDGMFRKAHSYLWSATSSSLFSRIFE
jgi:hypothetical protein